MITVHHRRGIAIISVLLIMIAVFTLGLGALFLSRLNLRISENVRSNSVVRYNTESGLDVSMIALEEYYLVNSEFPPGNTPPAILSNLSVVAEGPDPGFTIFEYDRIDLDTAMLKARGTLANGAEHVAELLVGIEFDSYSTQGYAPNGLRSEGAVFINGGGQGGGSLFIDAGVHGNMGFSILGQQTFQICLDSDNDGNPDRDANGVCVSLSDPIPIEDAPISGSPPDSVCPVGSTCPPDPLGVDPKDVQCMPKELCDSGLPTTQIDPIDVNPDYVGKRDGAIDEMSQAVEDAGGTIRSNIFVDSNGDAMYCDYVVTTAIDYTTLAAAITTLQASGVTSPTMCLEFSSALSVSDSDPNGATIDSANIVANGNIDFEDGTVSINDSTLVSMSGGIFSYDGTGSGNNVDAAIDNSSIFSQLSIGIHGQGSSYTGITTIASAGDITVDGQAPAVIDGGPGVGLVLLAEGDITINGSSDWYVAAVAGGTFDQNGTSFIYGGVEAVGDLTLNGGIDIDSGLGFYNPIFEEEPTPVVVVISRR